MPPMTKNDKTPNKYFRFFNINIIKATIKDTNDKIHGVRVAVSPFKYRTNPHAIIDKTLYINFFAKQIYIDTAIIKEETAPINVTETGCLVQILYKTRPP